MIIVIIFTTIIYIYMIILYMYDCIMLYMWKNHTIDFLAESEDLWSHRTRIRSWNWSMRRTTQRWKRRHGDVEKRGKWKPKGGCLYRWNTVLHRCPKIPNWLIYSYGLTNREPIAT